MKLQYRHSRSFSNAQQMTDTNDLLGKNLASPTTKVDNNQDNNKIQQLIAKNLSNNK